MKINIREKREVTHEGGVATATSYENQIRRSVLNCFLWEDTFYESGEDIYKRIQKLCSKVSLDFISNLAEEVRSTYHLRHVPLILLLYLIKNPTQRTKYCINKVLQRPDELGELVALYWKEGKRPLSHQLREGLKLALRKFNKYELAKWQGRRNKVSLKDIVRLIHPKARSEEENEIYKLLSKGKLRNEDTWEMELSSGKDKKEVWERLLREKKLGGLALLRNLRNMEDVGVEKKLIRESLKSHPFQRVLPFRFIAAAKIVPYWEKELDKAFLRVLIGKRGVLKGRTILLIDVSGSMDSNISIKSDLTRLDAACGIAMIGKELCKECDILTFSQYLVRVPSRRGIALRDAIFQSQSHRNTYLGEALRVIENEHTYDRLIVITDEQSHDNISLKGKGYLINVGAYKNGVSYNNNWVHIDGFSEAVMKYIIEVERENATSKI